jgi:SAM-dependent MidA family methyltransferase
MWPTWRQAMTHALYGPDGFYRRTRPREHFRTSVTGSTRFASAIRTLVRDLGANEVVDIGAGGGELLIGLYQLCPELRLTAVEVGPRPVDLPESITWSAELPESITGLVVANEWLDNVPVDVVEATESGLRVVLVDDSELGPVIAGEDLAWLNRWWPLESVGARAEIGHPRDEAWAEVIRRLDHGVAIAVDYSHELGARPPLGTLAGYRDGQLVPPIPDGSCDLTAHVALDSCAAAGIAAGATETVLTTQRAALRALGIRGERPPIEQAGADPVGYVRALARAGEEGELIDRGGLGSFGWLVQSVGGCLPVALAATMGA